MSELALKKMPSDPEGTTGREQYGENSIRM